MKQKGYRTVFQSHPFYCLELGKVLSPPWASFPPLNRLPVMHSASVIEPPHPLTYPQVKQLGIFYSERDEPQGSLRQKILGDPEGPQEGSTVAGWSHK